MPPLINGGVRLASSVDTKTDRWRGDRMGYVKATKSLDLLVKRGAVGTGVFDGHLGRTACEDNVNFNEELGLARQSQERKKNPAVSNPEAAGSSSTE